MKPPSKQDCGWTFIELSMNKNAVKCYVINAVNFSPWRFLRLDKASLSVLSFEYKLHNRWNVIEWSGQKHGLPRLLCNYQLDVRMCNQFRTPWQLFHSEHTGRRPLILHVPVGTDASTSRLQHVWPYCTHAQHRMQLNVLRLSKHDDGETSSKYQSSRWRLCFQWLGFEKVGHAWCLDGGYSFRFWPHSPAVKNEDWWLLRDCFDTSVTEVYTPPPWSSFHSLLIILVF